MLRRVALGDVPYFGAQVIDELLGIETHAVLACSDLGDASHEGGTNKRRQA